MHISVDICGHTVRTAKRLAMTERVNEEAALMSINEASMEGLKVTAIKELDPKAPNCMACVYAASYEITIREKINLSKDFVARSIDYISQETIPVNKPKKKGGGSVAMDLKKYIYDYGFKDDRTLYILINSGSETNIRPDFVMNLLCENSGVDICENPYDIHRVDIYENVSAEEGNVELRTLI